MSTEVLIIKAYFKLLKIYDINVVGNEYFEAIVP